MVFALFSKIRVANTPEKVAENDYLMKCKVLLPIVSFRLISLSFPGVMRIIITARQTLSPVFQDVLSNLVAILGEISKNPSNPNFNQYCFESISALMRYEGNGFMPTKYTLMYLCRFVVAGNPTTLAAFEAVLFGPFQIILQQDIDRTCTAF
jgi:exportin-2 (importin alpha re-exporter)